MNRILLLLFTLVLVAGTGNVRGQEWPRFRGPNGAGVSSATTIPSKWSEADVNWKVTLPGVGHSSPVVWGDRLFLLANQREPDRILLLAVDAERGTVLWERASPFAPFNKHQYNSYASSSPAVDAERVYAAWSTPDRYTLAAFDHDGNEVWQRDLGPFVSQHGSGTSPIVYQGKVILANDQDARSFILAVEARTGETVWRLPRESEKAAYSTPCLLEQKNADPSLIINSWAHGITAVDPGTGRVLWAFPHAFDKRSVSSPVVASGLVIGSCGSGAGGNYLVAVRPGSRDGSRPPELAYRIRRSAPYVPTSIAVDEWLFLWSDGGIVSCVHAPTGKVHYQERVPGRGQYFGSPVCVDGRLFAVSADGEVVVVEASEKFRVLGVNPLEDTCHSTPAVANGRMFIHTFHHLFSIGGGERPSE